MYFFETLPNLAPAPTVADTGKILAIIPVFKDAYFFEKFPDYLKAAIYSRQTWLLHTDATAQNVAIKLYIDDALTSEAWSILELNGFDGSDVLWFNAPPLPDTHLGVWGRLGKKLCLYWDEQLAEYDKIVYWDADMFKLPEPNHANFFARLTETGTDPIYLDVFTTPRRRDWRPPLIRETVRNVRKGGIPIQDIFTRAGLGRVLQEVHGFFARPATGLGIYPAKHFHSAHQGFVAWLSAHGPYIGDDELSLALAMKQFNIWIDNVQRLWGLTFINIHKYLRGDTDHACVHGQPIPSDEGPYRDILTTIGSYSPKSTPAQDVLLPG